MFPCCTPRALRTLSNNDLPPRSGDAPTIFVCPFSLKNPLRCIPDFPTVLLVPCLTPPLCHGFWTLSHSAATLWYSSIFLAVIYQFFHDFYHLIRMFLGAFELHLVSRRALVHLAASDTAIPSRRHPFAPRNSIFRLARRGLLASYATDTVAAAPRRRSSRH